MAAVGVFDGYGRFDGTGMVDGVGEILFLPAGGEVIPQAAKIIKPRKTMGLAVIIGLIVSIKIVGLDL